MRTLARIVLVSLCVIIGIYPLIYLLADGKIGLLQLKSDTLLSDGRWRVGFYTHIVTGGVALLIGWAQFVPSWRKRNVRLHRIVGQLYVFMVCLSGGTAVYIAGNSSTGVIASLGFGSLGVVWLFATLQGYRCIRQRNFRRHESLMVYSYSACCAAVTLRLWLPLLLGVFRLDFAAAYPIVAWLCWIPNLIVARFITSKVRASAVHPKMVDVTKPVTIYVDGKVRFRGLTRPSPATALESFKRRRDWGLIYPIKIELAAKRTGLSDGRAHE